MLPLSYVEEETEMKALLNRSSLMKNTEVAEVLGLKVSTIKAKTAKGEIPSVKMGRAVRYRPEDIYRYIVDHTRSKATLDMAA